MTGNDQGGSGSPGGPAARPGPAGGPGSGSPDGPGSGCPGGLGGRPGPALRKDPVLGRWVIISAERAKRPSDFAVPKNGPAGENPEPGQPSGGPGKACPFCPGNEAMTPPEVYRSGPPGGLGGPGPAGNRGGSGSPGGPGWQVRVVPNRFPALVTEGEPERQGIGIYDRMNGIGAHEVIIETPEHERRLGDLPPEQVELVLRAFRARALDLHQDPRIRYIMVFKNEGASAGASLAHSHSQLIATPILPVLVKEELAGAGRYYEFRGRCVYCDMVKQEMQDRERLVAVGERFIAFAPFAPRFPFETWLVARDHFATWRSLDDARTADLARVLAEVLRRLNRALGPVDYNFVIHTGPAGSPGGLGGPGSPGDQPGPALLEERPAPAEPDLAHYHFHLELLPKLSKIAGFEVGTGFYINPVPPEDAARYLREA